MNAKEIISQRARKDKKFIRLLKELKLYKRFFHMLEKHGNEIAIPLGYNNNKTFKRMCNYLFYGFTWANDEKITSPIWANLYDILEDNETIICKSKTLPLNKLKNNKEWRYVEATLKQQ